jgi:hypothetical protein
MSHQITEQKSSQWVYATITLYDGDRVLSPTHVSSNRVIFQTPPALISSRVEIVITNGPDEFRSTVDVLPHDPYATEIPIRESTLTGIETSL